MTFTKIIFIYIISISEISNGGLLGLMTKPQNLKQTMNLVNMAKPTFAKQQAVKNNVNKLYQNVVRNYNTNNVIKNQIKNNFKMQEKNFEPFIRRKMQNQVLVKDMFHKNVYVAENLNGKGKPHLENLMKNNPADKFKEVLKEQINTGENMYEQMMNRRIERMNIKDANTKVEINLKNGNSNANTKIELNPKEFMEKKDLGKITKEEIITLEKNLENANEFVINPRNPTKLVEPNIIKEMNKVDVLTLSKENQMLQKFENNLPSTKDQNFKFPKLDFNNAYINPLIQNQEHFQFLKNFRNNPKAQEMLNNVFYPKSLKENVNLENNKRIPPISNLPIYGLPLNIKYPNKDLLSLKLDPTTTMALLQNPKNLILPKTSNNILNNPIFIKNIFPKQKLITPAIELEKIKALESKINYNQKIDEFDNVLEKREITLSPSNQLLQNLGNNLKEIENNIPTNEKKIVNTNPKDLPFFYEVLSKSPAIMDLQQTDPLLNPNLIKPLNFDMKKIISENPALLSLPKTENYFLANYVKNDLVAFKEQNKNLQEIKDQSKMMSSVKNIYGINYELYPNYMQAILKENPQIFDKASFKEFLTNQKLKNSNYIPRMPGLVKIDALPQIKLNFEKINNLKAEEIKDFHVEKTNININQNNVENNNNNYNWRINIFKKEEKIEENDNEETIKDKMLGNFFLETIDNKPKEIIMDLPFYNLVLDLEEICIDNLEIDVCAEISNDLKNFYFPLDYVKKRDFEFIKKAVSELFEKNEKLESFKNLLNGKNIYDSLVLNFAKMFSRLEYLSFEFIKD